MIEHGLQRCLEALDISTNEIHNYITTLPAEQPYAMGYSITMTTAVIVTTINTRPKQTEKTYLKRTLKLSWGQLQ